ncbi:pseudouridine synthase [Massariosphaeria phaeospora]|uniref:Pseudouridine synthase n=1 Tax=Massariosphaeria phaeospora TaxID=100035 RepID=A0A7C8I9M4_9PLEO|nr:pseudouridine synthase [Massariosphaeria phaeospora]
MSSPSVPPGQRSDNNVPRGENRGRSDGRGRASFRGRPADRGRFDERGRAGDRGRFDNRGGREDYGRRDDNWRGDDRRYSDYEQRDGNRRGDDRRPSDYERRDDHRRGDDRRHSDYDGRPAKRPRFEAERPPREHKPYADHDGVAPTPSKNAPVRARGLVRYGDLDADMDDDVDAGKEVEQKASTLPQAQSENEKASGPPQAQGKDNKASQSPQAQSEDKARELKVCIDEYVSDNRGFYGVLKARYTDFLVSEIGLDGVVTTLGDVSDNVGLSGEEQKRMGVQKKGFAKEKKEKKGNKGKKGKVAEEHRDHKGQGDVRRRTPVKSEAEDAGETTAGETKIRLVIEDGAGAGPDQTANPQGDVQKPSEDDVACLDFIFGEGPTKQIMALAEAVRRHENRKAKDFNAVVVPPMLDKEKRTLAHQRLRQVFGDLLESSMEEDKSIRIKAVPPEERGPKVQRKPRDVPRTAEVNWDNLGGQFLHFSLYKQNKDTMNVIEFLGSKLAVGGKPFGYAGNKDRRACTVQRVSVKRVTKERMEYLNKTLFNAAMGDFEYKKSDLNLGDLTGNEFVITLRKCHFQFEKDGKLVSTQDIQVANDIVSKAIQDFSAKGFINYFGLQRFGTFKASSDIIGLKVIKLDYEGAIADILAFTNDALAAAEGTGNVTLLVSQDDRDRAKALNIWKGAKDGKGALDLLPKRFTAERNIISHLISKNSHTGKYDREKDYEGAFWTIPRNLRQIYVHAYQSLVWNHVASRRWKTYGEKVVKGDMVLEHEHKAKLEAKSTVYDQDGELVIDPRGADSSHQETERYAKARQLTEAEAESGRYSVYDIVLPQPGWAMWYPIYAAGNFYQEFMESKRGGEMPVDQIKRNKDLSVQGDYRKFLAKPLKPLEYQVREYVDDKEQFVETELERALRVREEKKAEAGIQTFTTAPAKVETGPDVVEDLDNDVDIDMMDADAKKLAVILKMQLAQSQYATIALRELMGKGGVQSFQPEYMGGR